MGIARSMYLIFLVRFGLGLVKHTQTICKAVITENLPVNEQSGILGRSAAWGSIGFIVGPFLSGHLSELPNGFFYVCTITSTLFIINFCKFDKMSHNLNKNYRIFQLSHYTCLKIHLKRKTNPLVMF